MKQIKKIIHKKIVKNIRKKTKTCRIYKNKTKELQGVFFDWSPPKISKHKIPCYLV